jgi:hypothetical protein
MGALLNAKYALVSIILTSKNFYLYIQVRTEALHEYNILSGFSVTGLIPYKPDRVLSTLNAPVHPPTPPPQAPPPVYTAATPHNIADLQQQADLIKQGLKRCRYTQSPPSPTEQGLNQMIKGCQLAMHSAVILASQNEQLLAENQRQKRERAKNRTYVFTRSIHTGAEGQEKINSQQQAELGNTSEARQRAPPRCSLCRSLEHKAPTCPGFQLVNSCNYYHNHPCCC